MDGLKSHVFVIGSILVSLCSHAWAAALPFGQTQTGTIGSVAQSNSYTFSADANDVVDFTIVATSGNFSPRILLYNPAGAQLSYAYSNAPFSCNGGSTVELNTVTLPTAGAYTVLISDCFDTNTGSYTIFTQRTNNPAGAGSLSFGGQPQTGTINSVAQANSYTFSANAKDVVDFTIVATSGKLSPRILLYNAAGAQLSYAYSNAPFSCNGGSTVELNTVTLPTAGAYTVLISDCFDTNTGSYAIFTQRTNNPAGAGSLSFGGQPQTGTINSVAQANSYTFGASANDVVDFTIVATSGKLSPRLLLYNPAGGQLSYAYSNAPFSCNSGSTVELNNLTIPATGTYTILVSDCFDTGTGNYNLSAQCFGVCAAPGSTQLPQTITFPPPNNQVLGAAPFALSATASSGLAVTFASNTASVCTVSGVTVTLVAVGTCSITASQGGNLTYFEAPEVTQTFAITSTSCSFALAPASQVIPAAAGTGSVGVLTNGGCPWTASSGASFLSLPSGLSGTGPGVVQFSATANSAPAARAGTLTIAGQAAMISQAGTAPLLLLSPSSLAVQWRQQGPLPATISLSVFTAANSLSFTATASSTGNWLTVSPASGSAPATVIATVNPSSLQPGTYQGTVTVTAPAANPSSQAFTVSLTVLAAGSPALSVTTTNLSYSFAQGAQQVQQQRILIGNSGGGTLSYTSSTSTNSGGNWLSVTQDGAGATPLTPDPLTVIVNPSALGVGTYTGQIAITGAGTTQNIPVTVTVSAVQQTILLSQTGLTFTAVVNGGIVPPQTFGILNSGNGVMDWSVSSSTVTGGNGWLSITPNSGATDASSLTVPLITVSVNPASLAPGQYSGQIQVASATANDTPQFVSVILNVLPAGSNPGPLVLPTGLIFTQAVGGTPAGSQTITLSNLTGSQLTFATGKLTTDGANWFSVTPATGAATPTQATTLTVSVSSTGLSPAIRQGVLTLLFQDGSVRTVNVLFLLATGGVSSNSAGVSRPLATGSCTPTKLLPLITSLGSQFTVPAGWPNTLATQVVDDCGNSHVSGTVTATFSNGDPPLPLISLKNGDWTGTWQVSNAKSSVIAITVNADNPSLNISGSISVSGGLQSSANAPVMLPGGVLNAASYLPSAPLAPGTMVAIFGSNLANGTTPAPTLPLGTQLSGTLVIIGGEPAPLLYAGQGQINAIIPYGLPVNTNTQVIVQQGNAYTSPQSITLSAANPGIFTTTSSGTGQGVIFRPDGQYAESGTPAQAGDEIVIYAVGLGETTPPTTAGQAATASPLLKVAAAVSLTIGGQNARVDFAGLAPGFAELYQINAAVPAGVSGNSVPVVLTVAGQPSRTVTMAVQ